MIITRTSYYMSPSSPNSISKGCCISRILRRILCFNSLPWHPLDHQHHQHQHHLLTSSVQEDDMQKKDCSSVIEAASARTNGPGLVARLMGLESVPHYYNKESPASDGDENSLKLKLGSKGRKVIPPCQELEEDEQFYTLRFGSSAASNRRRNKTRSKIGGSGNKENEEIRVSNWKKDGDFRQPLMNKNVSDSEKATDDRIIEAMREKKKNEKEEVIVEGEESENSSPNSVLEFVEFPPADHRSTASSGEISRLANSKMRRTLSDELENCGKPKERNPKNKNQICHQYSLYAEEELIGNLAAMEMAKSRWMIVQDEILKNDQCLKEIGRDVASDILDHLLDELIINDFLFLF